MSQADPRLSRHKTELYQCELNCTDVDRHTGIPTFRLFGLPPSLLRFPFLHVLLPHFVPIN